MLTLSNNEYIQNLQAPHRLRSALIGWLFFATLEKKNAHIFLGITIILLSKKTKKKKERDHNGILHKFKVSFCICHKVFPESMIFPVPADKNACTCLFICFVYL